MEIYRLFSDFKTYDCSKGAYATVLNYIGYDFRLDYYNTWGFEYHFDDYRDNNTIGGNLDVANESINIHRRKSLKMERKIITSSTELMEYIIQHVDRNIPIICDFNSYFCPWLPDYHIHHGQHTTIIHNITSSYAQCIDVIPLNTNCIFPTEELCKSYAVFTCIENIHLSQTYEYVELTKNVVNKFLNNNFFEAMREWQNIIEDEFDLQKERIYFERNWIYANPFFKDILSLLRSRNQFRLFLLFLKDCSEYNLREILQEFDKVCLEWERLWHMMLRIFLTKKSTVDCRKIIATKLHEIICLEEGIAEKETAENFV